MKKDKFEILSKTFKTPNNKVIYSEFLSWINHEYNNGEGYQYIEKLGEQSIQTRTGYDVTITALFKIL